MPPSSEVSKPKSEPAKLQNTKAVSCQVIAQLQKVTEALRRFISSRYLLMVSAMWKTRSCQRVGSALRCTKTYVRLQARHHLYLSLFIFPLIFALNIWLFASISSTRYCMDRESSCNLHTVQQDTQSVPMIEFYSPHMLALHVSNLTVLLDTSSRYSWTCPVVRILPHTKSAHTACKKRSWRWTGEVQNMWWIKLNH